MSDSPQTPSPGQVDMESVVCPVCKNKHVHPLSLAFEGGFVESIPMLAPPVAVKASMRLVRLSLVTVGFVLLLVIVADMLWDTSVTNRAIWAALTLFTILCGWLFLPLAAMLLAKLLFNRLKTIEKQADTQTLHRTGRDAIAQALALDNWNHSFSCSKCDTVFNPSTGQKGKFTDVQDYLWTSEATSLSSDTNHR